MKFLPLVFSLIFILLSCSASKRVTKTQTILDNNTFQLTEVSTDETYGLSPKNPVEVGGVKDDQGVQNERRYLNSLAGPNGEAISYFRSGSCCPIKSDNNPLGFDSVMLDSYQVTWENSTDTVSIYINMYDAGELKAPVGFTIKK